MTDDNKSFAFPCTGEGYNSSHYTQKGMTLRDYFAGQALIGIVASGSFRDLTDSGDDSPHETIASYAYGYADAMLSERECA